MNRSAPLLRKTPMPRYTHHDGDQLIEIWKAIPGFEGWAEVSDLGRLRSLDRVYVNKIGISRRFKGKLIDLYLNCGYPAGNLPSPGGQKKVVCHRAVLLAFVGIGPEGSEACHWDGDRTNASLSNLRWASRAENHADKRRHGTHLEGERIHNAKLTTAAVRVILASSASSNAMGRRFGVTGATVRGIRLGKSWVHVANQPLAGSPK